MLIDTGHKFIVPYALVDACEKGRFEDVRVLVEGHDVEKTGMSVDENGQSGREE